MALVFENVEFLPICVHMPEVIQVLLIFLFLRDAGHTVDSNMKRMLDVVPKHIHERTGIFIGRL